MISKRFLQDLRLSLMSQQQVNSSAQAKKQLTRGNHEDTDKDKAPWEWQLLPVQDMGIVNKQM